MKESHSKTKQEYEDITRLIDTEKEKKMDQLISALVSLEQRENKETNSKEKSSEDRLLKNDDEYIAMISLLSLRIKAGCELIRSGLSDMLGQFKEDIEELLSYVQSLEYEWKISETVRSDAYDLLRAVCLPEDRLKILLSTVLLLRCFFCLLRFRNTCAILTDFMKLLIYWSFFVFIVEQG